MKPFLTLMFCALLGTAHAQLELIEDFSFPYDVTVTWAMIDQDMPKILAYNANNIQVYNPDFTLYADIDIPAEYPDQYVYTFFVTRSLFDCDTTQLEYLISCGTPVSDSVFVRVLREDGTVLFALDDYAFVQSSVFQADPTRSSAVSDSTGTYLFFSQPFFGSGYRLYRACGQLPRLSQSYSGGVSTGFEQGLAPVGTMRIFPNPSQGFVQVDYDLQGNHRGNLSLFNTAGEKVMEKDLGAVFDHVVLDVSSLAVGTYVVKITAENGAALTQKMVKVE